MSPWFQRQVRTPRLSWADQAVPAALARLLPGNQLRQLRLIVSLRTLLRWHADLVRRRRAYQRRAPGQSRTAPAIRALELEMARDNSTPIQAAPPCAPQRAVPQQHEADRPQHPRPDPRPDLADDPRLVRRPLVRDRVPPQVKDRSANASKCQ